FVTDVVVAGHDRDEAAALVVPNLAACRELVDTSNGAADPAEILACDGVRNKFASLLETFNAKAGGSSGRLARLILMDDPPSLDSGEMTDKGSVNQRAVLSRRAALVEELYVERPSSRVVM
ncbi:MAG: feruloyl-CoA synthase, partial [Roseiarcus sp.]